MSSGTSFYNGQERGYWTAGSFSARVPVDMVYPVGFAPPSLKMGCGGIDFFGGGVSLMNFQYLVQKFQGTLASAATVAFDMALKVLCPICSETLRSVEATPPSTRTDPGGVLPDAPKRDTAPEPVFNF